MTQSYHVWVIYLKNSKSIYIERYLQIHVCWVLFTKSKQWDQPRYSQTDEWIKKIQYMYTVKFYLAIEINETK